MIDLEKHGLRVKPLEWRQYCPSSGNSSAKVFGGEYICERAGPKGHFGLWYPGDHEASEPRAYFKLRNAAKAAAQADYEARIIAALEIVRPIGQEE